MKKHLAWFNAFLAASVLSLASAACASGSGDAHEKSATVADGVIDVKGQIDWELAAEFESIARQNEHSVTTIRITSTGGDASAALRMAERIATNKWNVIVKDFCISACASYILLAGRERRVLPNSFVAFHMTPSALSALLGRSPLKNGVPLFSEQARREQAFYEKAEVDKSLLLVGAAVLEPVCVAEDEGAPRTSPWHFGVGSRYSAFVPSHQALAMMGMQVSGYWPQSQSELNSIISRHPFKSSFHVRYVDTINKRLPPFLPKCSQFKHGT